MMLIDICTYFILLFFILFLIYVCVSIAHTAYTLYQIRDLEKKKIEKYISSPLKRLKTIERLHQFQKEANTLNSEYPPIYCLMITGKDDERIRFASASVRNFLYQSYSNKYLHIFNHNEQLSVLDQLAEELEIEKESLQLFFKDRVFEYKIDKPKERTLGMLRNMMLQMIPINTYWITWDDDDWRTLDFLETLYHEMRGNDADAIAFTKRFEHNSTTNYTWMIELKTGLPFVLAKQNPMILYKDLERLEDLHLISDMRSVGMKVHIYDNNPRLYIRLVHTNNTSPYVDRYKTKIKFMNDNQLEIKNKDGIETPISKYIFYNEMNVSGDDIAYVNKKLSDLIP